MHWTGPIAKVLPSLNYISELLVPKDSVYATRSSIKHNFEIPRTKTKMGEHAFSVSAPTLWQKIPEEMKLSQTVEDFKSKLKTFLFKKAYKGKIVYKN